MEVGFKTNKWRLIFLSGLVLVYAVLPIAGSYAWLFRLIATAILFTIMAIVMFLYGLHPNIKLIKGGKLYYEGGVRLQRYELFFKVCSAVIGFMILIWMIFPLVKGSFLLANYEAKLESVTGRIEERSSFMGLWFIGQTIYLHGSHTGYLYLFSIERPPRRGAEYALYLLPGTKFILVLDRLNELHAPTK